MNKIQDWLGCSVSFICFIHCMALVYLSQLIGVGYFLANEEKFHNLIFIPICALAFASMILSYSRHLRQKHPTHNLVISTILILGGVSSVGIGTLNHHDTYVVLGSLLLVAGHTVNLMTKTKTCTRKDCPNTGETK